MDITDVRQCNLHSAPAISPTAVPSTLPLSNSQIDEKANPHDGEESETEQARIERLGRERPAKFKSMWAEIFFCYSILASQFMAVSGSFQHLLTSSVTANA